MNHVAAFVVLMFCLIIVPREGGCVENPPTVPRQFPSSFGGPAVPVPLPGARVATPGLRDVVDTVEKSYALVIDVSADFFQRTYLAESKREMRAEGQMFLKIPQGNSPTMFRFDYYKPTTQQIVCNGRTQWIYLPQNREVIQSDVASIYFPTGMNNPRYGAPTFIQGLGRLSQDFQINFATEYQDQAGNYILELNPRRSSVTIGKLFMVVDRGAVDMYLLSRKGAADAVQPYVPFPILSTTVRDQKGNWTTIELSNIRTNNRLATSLFEFNMPAGVQVVTPSARAPRP